MPYNQRDAYYGVTNKPVSYNSCNFSSTGPAHPILPPSGPRAAFRSTPPATGVKTFNLSALLPENLPRSTSAASSTSSTGVWTTSRSLSITNLHDMFTTAVPQRRRQRRSSTTSMTSQQSQNTWVARSRTPESQNKAPAPLKVRKIKTSQKKTKQQPKKKEGRTKKEKIAGIYSKGEKLGKLSGSVWYKAPEGGKAPARKPVQNRQRPAAKRQSTTRRQARKPATRVQPSSETLKTLKKLRKKVKQCSKIQENLNRGVAVEVNQLSKLKQLDEFKQQIALLELEFNWKLC